MFCARRPHDDKEKKTRLKLLQNKILNAPVRVGLRPLFIDFEKSLETVQADAFSRVYIFDPDHTLKDGI